MGGFEGARSVQLWLQMQARFRYVDLSLAPLFPSLLSSPLSIHPLSSLGTPIALSPTSHPTLFSPNIHIRPSFLFDPRAAH